MVKFSIFFLIFFILFIFPVVNNKNPLNTKRIEETIKLILTNINSVKSVDRLSFNYEKYTIIFNNFIILNQILDNIKILNNENNIYTINNITISLLLDLNIIFYKKDNIYIDKNVCIDMTFSSINIKYFPEKDIIKLDSLTELNNFIFDSILNKLNYFNSYNNKSCIYQENNNNEIMIQDPQDKLIDKCKKIFIKGFQRLQADLNLLTYDVIQLFNNLTTINCSEYTKINLTIDYIIINKVKLYYYNIIFEEDYKQLKIEDIFLEGYFKSISDDKEFKFNFTLLEQDNITFFENYMEFPKNLSVYCDDPFQKKYITEALIKEYGNDLNSTYKEYIKILKN